MTDPTEEQTKALVEFTAIRKVLRVPFPEDMGDLKPPELPGTPNNENRRWKGPCLGYRSDTIPVEIETSRKKT